LGIPENCGNIEPVYQNNAGQANCINCPKGYYCSSESDVLSDRVSKPLNCTEGDFCEERTSIPTPCAVGFFNPDKGGVSSRFIYPFITFWLECVATTPFNV
jgi:hypothetical protein